MTKPTASVAEDEAPLRAELGALLGQLWPDLQVVAEQQRRLSPPRRRHDQPPAGRRGDRLRDALHALAQQRRRARAVDGDARGQQPRLAGVAGEHDQGRTALPGDVGDVEQLRRDRDDLVDHQSVRGRLDLPDVQPARRTLAATAAGTPPRA